ncbi:MAG: hypothetical protein ACOCRO_09370 [Halanaerobiales bacterium]
MKIVNIDIPVETDSKVGTTERISDLNRSFNGSKIGVFINNYRNFNLTTGYIDTEVGEFLYNFFNGSGDLWDSEFNWSAKGYKIDFISDNTVSVITRSVTLWSTVGEVYTLSPPNFYLNGSEITEPSFVNISSEDNKYRFDIEIESMDNLFIFNKPTPKTINEKWVGFILESYPECLIKDELGNEYWYDIFVEDVNYTADGDGMIFDLDFEVIK